MYFNEIMDRELEVDYNINFSTRTIKMKITGYGDQSSCG